MTFGILDGLKIGAGAALGGAVVFGWMNLFTIPAAELVAFDAGEAQCRQEVAKEHAANLTRQEAANQVALEEARQRELNLAEQADDLNEQLLDLANGYTRQESHSPFCVDPGRLPNINAIR